MRQPLYRKVGTFHQCPRGNKNPRWMERDCHVLLKIKLTRNFLHVAVHSQQPNKQAGDSVSTVTEWRRIGRTIKEEEKRGKGENSGSDILYCAKCCLLGSRFAASLEEVREQRGPQYNKRRRARLQPYCIEPFLSEGKKFIVALLPNCRLSVRVYRGGR